MARIFIRSTYIWLFIAMLLWGSTFPATKFVLQTYDPFWVIFIRLAIASVIFVSLKSRWGTIRYQAGDWKWLIMLALFEPCCYFVFEMQALRFTSASEAAMITALLPIAVTGGAWLFFHERISLRKGIGLCVAVAGVMLLTAYAQSTQTAPHPVFGNILQCGAVLCATGYSLAVKHIGKRYPVFFLTALQVLIGTFFFLPFLFLPFVEMPSVLNKGAILTLLYLSVFCSGIPYFLYSYCMTKIPAYHASMGSNLIPVFGVLLGWILLKEVLTPVQYVAIPIIFIGIFLGSDMWVNSGKRELSIKQPPLQ